MHAATTFQTIDVYTLHIENDNTKLSAYSCLHCLTSINTYIQTIRTRSFISEYITVYKNIVSMSKQMLQNCTQYEKVDNYRMMCIGVTACAIHCPNPDIKLTAWAIHCPNPGIKLTAWAIHCPNPGIKLSHPGSYSVLTLVSNSQPGPYSVLTLVSNCHSLGHTLS